MKLSDFQIKLATMAEKIGQVTNGNVLITPGKFGRMTMFSLKLAGQNMPPMTTTECSAFLKGFSAAQQYWTTTTA